MLKYNFYNCNSWFKKRSHGYVNAKAELFLKKFLHSVLFSIIIARYFLTYSKRSMS